MKKTQLTEKRNKDKLNNKKNKKQKKKQYELYLKRALFRVETKK